MSDNTENNKRIAKNTILLYIRMFLTMTISLYTSRIVLNTLGVEDFGIYNVVGGIVIMFGFLNSSMVNATQRYISFELGRNNLQNLQKIFSTTILIHIIIAIIIIILAETIGIWLLYNKMIIPEERINAAFWLFQFSIFSFVITVISVPYNATIIAREKMSIYAYVSILEITLKLLSVIILAWINYDKLKVYSFLIFIITAITFTIYKRYCKKHYTETKFIFYWDKPLIKELLAYAGWNLFSNLACSASSQGVNILLNMFFGPTINAARGIAYQVQGAIVSFSSNFMTAVNPQIIKSYAANNTTYTLNLMYSASKYSYILIFIISLPIILECEYILELWLGNVPKYAPLFVQLILINSIIDTLGGPIQTIVQATGKIRIFQTITGLIILTVLPITYLTFKLGYDATYAFYIGIGCSIVLQIIRILLLKNLINVSYGLYIKKTILPICSISLISVLCMNYIKKALFNETNVTNFLLMVLISSLVILLTSYFIGLNKSEKAFFNEKVLKWKRQ